MQGIKIIKLQNGGSTIVDAEDYKNLNKHRWFRSSHGYAHRQGWNGTQRDSSNHWCIFMHRVVNKTPDNAFTDHINGNKLDNRRSNLRTCDKAQNSTNRPKIKRKSLTSRLKGVSFHPASGLWRARITDRDFERTTYHRTEQLAAADYNRLATERFGEYAHLNVLPS